MIESNPQTLKILRSILRIWRQQSQKPIRQSQPYKYLLDQYRNFQLTQQQLCKGPKEIEHLAKTYATYLSSTQKLHELQKQYRGKGERSVEETARLVGLKVPDNPRHPDA